MIQKQRRKQAAMVAGVGLGVAATLWGMKRWQQLKQTPPVSPRSHHAGMAGYFQQVGDWRMFTRVTPNEDKGLPVVLIHGLVMSGRAMEPLALALSRDYHVLVPDLPGFGASTLPASAPVMSVDQQAEALWLWLQHNGFQRAIWVGNSFGCQILAALAVKHPQAVAGLVLQGPTVDRHARSLPRQLWRDWRNGRLETRRPPGPLARIDYAKAGLRRAFGTMREMMRDHIEHRLTYINAPTLLLRGSRDPVCPARWLDELAALMPHSELITLRDGTHTLHYVYPWSFCHAIRPFLARIQQENQHE
ncbi:alpha/beta hydrolase [Pantoea vagans]|uniref:alpha/beta fold hydrolase n=1 Tax=Pantoea sp. EKM101V TaxID=1683695 RepID=UPI00073F99C8|nr:alpha/beta hydrolase [Pantoea sp. EKM101V]KAF6663930.1 alpha/beta fold hydrolase [Pantoea sp. EKM101V]TPE11758.1 alpha/beta hydrolase [Pantoea vagans]